MKFLGALSQVERIGNAISPSRPAAAESRRVEQVFARGIDHMAPRSGYLTLAEMSIAARRADEAHREAGPLALALGAVGSLLAGAWLGSRGGRR